MSSIHAKRAKEWGTNPFIAEWLSNAVTYCKDTPEGRMAFQQWLVRSYGPDEAKNRMQEVMKPPRKKYGTPKGNALLWNASGVELGVSDEAIKLYHYFTGENNLCTPQRTKPAPKRRRGESSAEWVARRHEALTEGCKLPNIDWDLARVIAISESDRARDTIELWRTDPSSFLETILARRESTIPSPEILNHSQEYIAFHTLDDAFRSRLYGLSLSYMTWSHAAELFEDLARRGLTTASAIEREYKKDSQLMWRLVTCICNVRYLSGHFWARLMQELSWCEYFRPYFKRWRTKTGLAMIEPDKLYIRKHGYKDSLVDELVVKYATGTDIASVSPFFDNILTLLDKNPSEAKKFSAEAFAEMGDVAMIFEFQVQMEQSPFGQRLTEYALSKDANRLSDPYFAPEISSIDFAKLEWSQSAFRDWPGGNAFVVTRSVGDTWLTVTSQQSMWEFMPLIFSTYSPLAFEAMWNDIDRKLWNAARMLDRTSTPGAVARRFGLINPDDPNKPSLSAWFFKLMDPTRSANLVASTTPAPARNLEQPNIPVAGLQDSAVKLGHAYLAEQEPVKSKERAKTRGVNESSNASTTNEQHAMIESEVELPDTMPFEFKIGKKIMKIFHRILEFDPTEEQEIDGVQKGQVRWGDFERAMKRVGFNMCQTAGSSVRFDPPAKTARPITFHRPHPDPILTPHLIKLVGARLKRCYGWTTATFKQGAE